MSKFGRYQAPDPVSALVQLHFHDGVSKLIEVDWEPKVDVLDQEDLDTQGIDVSTFITGAPKGVTALGSCTAQTFTEAMSNILSPQQFAAFVAKLGAQELEAIADVWSNTVAAERAAIGFYHICTDQTADSATEWPPTDCGSSGPYVYKEGVSLGLVKAQQIAHGAQNIVSLMQTGGLLVGMPYLNDWMNPPSSGIVDGDGSASTLQQQINDGVAGGHEIYFSAIEKLTLLPTGQVDPQNTIVRFRNHWGNWADNGSGYFHLSTIVSLGSQVDLRQFS